MKKNTLIIFFVIILLFPVIIADNVSDNPENETTGNIKNLNNKIMSELGNIPSQLHLPSRIIFGIKNTSGITIGKFTILVALFLMFLYIIKDTLVMMPFLNKGWQKYLGSLVITLLISITGAINGIANFFFGLKDDLEWLKSLGVFNIILGIIFAGIILFCVHYLLSMLQNKIQKNEEFIAEEGAKDLASFIKNSSRSIEDISKNKK